MIQAVAKLASYTVAGIGIGIGMAVTNLTLGRYVARNLTEKVLEDMLEKPVEPK